MFDAELSVLVEILHRPQDLKSVAFPVASRTVLKALIKHAKDIKEQEKELCVAFLNTLKRMIIPPSFTPQGVCCVCVCMCACARESASL